MPRTYYAKRPPLYKLLLETRAPYELGAFALTFPLLQHAPRGDGHPVFVLPGFMASGRSTIPLRLFLRSRGYATYDWGQGRNYGRGLDLRKGVTRDANSYREIVRLQAKYGKKVSLIGWSLGGVYARELARLAPESVRSVITLGSPFNENPHANNISPLFERISRKRIQDFDRELLEQASEPPPVPTTSIYSRTDGVVAWECCIERLEGETENIAVAASHTGLGLNPLVHWVIADRLAQPEGAWKPFTRNGLRCLFYPAPASTS